jgi:hypothetical protein
MTVIAEGMTFDAVDATPTAAARLCPKSIPKVNLNSF